MIKKLILLLGLNLCSVCAYCFLHGMNLQCWSWGPLKAGLCLASHWISLTVLSKVIHGLVLCGHKAQLQGELVLGCVSGHGGMALEGWAIVSVTIIFYLPQPFQALLWGLLEPSPVATTVNGVTWDSTGDGRVCEGFIRLGPDSYSCIWERTFGDRVKQEVMSSNVASLSHPS
jgi:hypothetical protein